MLTRLPPRAGCSRFLHGGGRRHSTWPSGARSTRSLRSPRSTWRWVVGLGPWALGTLALAKGNAFSSFSSCEEKALKLKTRSAGDPNTGKPTMVLVHGLDSWSGTWQALMETLAKRGIRTLAVDLRGHGESELGNFADFSPEQLAADVRATLKANGCEGKRVALVGHSMGGRIAMQYAAAYPEDLNLLVIEDMDCVPRTYSKIEGEELKRYQSFTREFETSDMAKKSLMTFDYDAERVESWFAEAAPRVYEKDGKVWSCINPYAQYLARQTVLNSTQGQRSFQQIAALTISGSCAYSVHVCVAGPGSRGTVCSWDKLPGGIRDMESVLPSLQVHEFPRAGHSIHNTELEKFADLLEALLKKTMKT